MTFSKIVKVLMCIVLATICLLPLCVAFEGTIMVVEKKNVSLNLSQEYNVSKNTSVAMAVQTISVNSTEPIGKNASIMLMSLSTEGSEPTQINQTAFSGFMEAMLLGAISLGGGKEMQSMIVKDSQGNNVTLHTFLIPASKNKRAAESVFAFWDLDEYTHAVLTSDLDLNTSARIVETLEIKP